jgi:heavy metal response regulator
MRVLLIEDEKKVARFIERGLREEHYAVDVARDGTEGVHLGLAFDYDIIVLDVLLPGLDGFQVLKELRTGGCQARVLMLTARDAVDDRVRGLDLGADDYLVKPFAFAEFLARLRALLRRAPEAEGGVLQMADLVLDQKAHKVYRQAQLIKLTAKEYGVLEFLLRHAGKVVTRTELAEHVWDLNFDSSTNVIDVTVFHLRDKVDRGFSPRLIHTVRGVGYTLDQSVTGASRLPRQVRTAP